MRTSVKKNLIVSLLGWVVWTGLFLSPGFGAEATLCFSFIPYKNVDQQISELSPIPELLEEKLGRPVKIVRPNSYHAVIEGILSNTIHVAILGPASYAKARARDKGVEAFASFSRKKGTITPGGSFYYSVLFTLKSSGVSSANDLRGQKVAFTDPESTSGALIPKLFFSKQVGQPLDLFLGAQIFTGSHDRAIQAVTKNNVPAAFVSTTRLDEAIRREEIDPDELVILWRSSPIPYDPFVFSSGMTEDLKNRIREILLSSPPQLESMLTAIHMDSIVPITDSDYQAIHDMVAAE